jgi:RimJ/RimL family protein N-acetyltransferase
MEEEFQALSKQKQEQMLKLVTHSFYKELKNYGVDSSDIVTVSVNLLDHITNADSINSNGTEYYNNLFKIDDIKDEWEKKGQLSIKDVQIKPLLGNQIAQVCEWLKISNIGSTFIGQFPKDEIRLADYLIEKGDHKYFSINSHNNAFVGVIGAENIDHNFKKLEMKKFIGNLDYQGKGIGKLATFLFLYFTFIKMKFNKVYIHSMDTNIKNINLNSKFGFGLEGILYGEVLLDNKFHDVLRMGLLRNTWTEIFS